MRYKFKDKVKDFFPWEDEEKKRKPQRMDSIPQKTSMTAKVKCKPRMEGQEYLEIYLMLKEKERLEKMGEVFGKIQMRGSDNWRETRKEIIKSEGRLPPVVPPLKGESGEEVSAGKKREGPRGPKKKVIFDY